MKKYPSIKFITFLIILVFCIVSQTSNANLLLFNTKEIQKTKDLNMFSKWMSVLKRHYNEYTQERKTCEKNKTECVYNKWFEFITETKKLNKEKQIKAVNSYMNKHKYIIDPINWGKPDYWATVKEFILKNGDCEDYAISKYLTLKLLGWENEKMRIVTVMDMNLNTPHSILAVYGKNDVYILDNQIPVVVSSYKIKHYLPIYSLNEKHWWTHKISYKDFY